MPLVSDNYKITLLSMEPQFLQAGGHIALEVKYSSAQDFEEEQGRLIALQYLPSKGSCGEKEQQRLRNLHASGQSFDPASSKVESLDDYSSMYFVYDKYGEIRYDQNMQEVGYTNGYYWNHGAYSYVLLDPSKGKILYSAIFW